MKKARSPKFYSTLAGIFLLSYSLISFAEDIYCLAYGYTVFSVLYLVFLALSLAAGIMLLTKACSFLAIPFALLCLLNLYWCVSAAIYIVKYSDTWEIPYLLCTLLSVASCFLIALQVLPLKISLGKTKICFVPAALEILYLIGWTVAYTADSDPIFVCLFIFEELLFCAGFAFLGCRIYLIKRQDLLKRAINAAKRERPCAHAEKASDKNYSVKVDRPACSRLYGQALEYPKLWETVLDISFYGLERMPEAEDKLYLSENIIASVTKENLYSFTFSAEIGKSYARKPHDFLKRPCEFLILEYKDGETVLLEQWYG